MGRCVAAWGGRVTCRGSVNEWTKCRTYQASVHSERGKEVKGRMYKERS